MTEQDKRDFKAFLFWLPFLILAIFTVYFAYTHPICTNETREGWFIERRFGFDVYVSNEEDARRLAPNSRIYAGTDYYKNCN